jgi:hypothetical protein
MTTRLLRFFAASLATAAFALALPAPAPAATVNFSNPSCASFSFTDLGGGSYSIRCNLPSVPVCTIAASSLTPATGSSLTLTATCTGDAFGWLWTGPATACSTYSPVCTDTQATAGAKTYTVFGGNGVGQGPVASVTVNWTTPTTPPTGCAVTRTTPSSGTLPQTGGAVQLNGACSGGSAVTAWEWRKNGATVSSQTTAQYAETLPANAGTSAITYSYEARACAGASCSAWTTPLTTVSVSGTTVSAGFCSQFPEVTIFDLPWAGTGTNPIDTAAFPPGFEPNRIYVGKLTVPAGAVPLSSPGSVTFVEHVDGQAQRVMSISSEACDFRGFVPGSASLTDPTGANYPLKWSNDINPQIFYQLGSSLFNAVLTPGKTYFVNIRNVNWNTGAQSCFTATCNGRFNVRAPY